MVLEVANTVSTAWCSRPSLTATTLWIGAIVPVEISA